VARSSGVLSRAHEWVASTSISPSTVNRRECSNSARTDAVKQASPGRSARLPPPGTPGTRRCTDPASAYPRTQSTESSSAFHNAASTPPGRSTRAISRPARSWSNQWNAWPTSTASTEASGSGMSSALPRSARTGPAGGASWARSTRSISGSGSTAVTRLDRRTREPVSLPVPAARSSSSSSRRADEPGPVSGASAQSTAASG
jgi:hypothetical protein